MSPVFNTVENISTDAIALEVFQKYGFKHF